MLQAVKLPASVSHLAASLANMDRNAFSLKRNKIGDSPFKSLETIKDDLEQDSTASSDISQFPYLTSY
jgi:hypothetical protein